MPYSLPIPKPFNKTWKVKIYDKESLYEEPHVTILFKDQSWRYALRSGDVLAGSSSPNKIQKKVLDAIEANYDDLCKQWDIRFPKNPVRGDDKEKE